MPDKPRSPLPRADSDHPPKPEDIGPVPSIRPASDDDRIARVEIVANAALQQVTALRGDFDGMKSGVELHVKSTVKAELDPIRVSLARQDTTLAQILEFSEKAAERAHRMHLDTLDEEIKVEDLRSKKVANKHAIEIDPRIDGAHKRRIAWAMAIAAIITAIGTLFGLSAASHGHAAPTAEPVDSHH